MKIEAGIEAVPDVRK